MEPGGESNTHGRLGKPAQHQPQQQFADYQRRNVTTTHLDNQAGCSIFVLMEIETLGDAYTHGVKLIMHCAHGKRDGMKTIRECTFRAELDTMTLIATRGREMPISRLQERLKCPRCESRRVRLVYSFPTNVNRLKQAG